MKISLFFMGDNNNFPSVSTKGSSSLATDSGEAAHAPGDNQQRKKNKNNIDKNEAADISANSGSINSNDQQRVGNINERDPLIDFLADKISDSDEYDDLINKLLIYNSEINQKSNTLCLLSEVQQQFPDNEKFEYKEFARFEKQEYNDLELLRELISPNKEPDLPKKLDQNITFIAPKFKTWRGKQVSYKVIPSSEQSDLNNSFVDFIGNTQFKCMVILSANSYPKGKIRLITNEVVESSYIAEEVDIISTDDVINTRNENKALINKSISINSIVNERMSIEERLNQLMDVNEPIYYPLSEFKDPITSTIPPIRCKSLRLLFSILHAIELNVEIDECTSLPISQSLKHFIPFMNAAIRHSDLKYHLVCPAIHIGFYFELAHTLNKLYDYVNHIDFLPLKAAFEISKMTNSEEIFISSEEIIRFANSVETCAFLSECISRLQCVAVMHSLPSNLIIYETSMSYLEGRTPMPFYNGLQSVPLYQCKFVKDENFLRINVSKFNHKVPAPGIVPTYWPILERLKIPVTPDIKPIKEFDNLVFQINTCKDRFIDPPIIFTPGTTFFMFV